MKLARAAVFCLAAACSSKPDASPSLASASASAAAVAPPHEAAMFPARRSVLHDLGALALIPNDAQAVFFVRSIEALEQKMGASAADARVREAIYAELDDESLAFSKDLGEVSTWAKLGIDRTKPIGHVTFDERGRVRGVMLPIADEAAWKAFLKKRKSGRVLREDGAVTVLSAKKDVTRAVVVRDGYAIVLREGASSDAASGTTLAALADRIAALPPAESLGKSAPLATELERNAFGELASGYVRATQLLAQKRARLRAERDRSVVDEGKQQVAKIEAELAKREEALQGAANELGDAFVVFGVDLVGDQLLGKGSLSFASAKPFVFGATKPLPETFAALRTSSLEGWGNVAPSLLDDVLATRDLGHQSALHRSREIVGDADLTGDVAFLARGAIALGLRDPAATEKKIAALPDTWKRGEDGVVSTVGLHFRVAGGSLVIARDVAFTRAFPAPVAGASAPAASAALTDLLRITGTSALFRFRPFEPTAVFDTGSLMALTSADNPCSPFGLLGMLGTPDEDQIKAREKACKKLNEIEAAIDKRKRAARQEIEKTFGTIEIVAKPRADGADFFAVLSTETPDFATLLKRTLDGFADGAPTAEEAKNRKALKAEVTAIDEEASKRFGEALGGFDSMSMGLSGGDIGDTGGMGGLSTGMGRRGGAGEGATGIGTIGGAGLGGGGLGGGSKYGTEKKKPAP